MRRRGARGRLLGLAACALVLAGCGSGSPARPATGSSPAVVPNDGGRAAFIARADAICRSLRTSLAQFAAPTKALAVIGETPQAFDLAARLFRRAAALERAELRRLRALTLPATGTSAATEYFRQGAEAVALLARLAGDFARRDKAAIAAAERDGTRMAAITKGLAQAYGFKVCGSGAGGNGLS